MHVKANQDAIVAALVDYSRQQVTGRQPIQFCPTYISRKYCISIWYRTVEATGLKSMRGDSCSEELLTAVHHVPALFVLIVEVQGHCRGQRQSHRVESVRLQEAQDFIDAQAVTLVVNPPKMPTQQF